jgi:hypothetical protein
MDSSSISVIFKQILSNLNDPLLTSDNLQTIFHFIINDLKDLYEENDTVKSGIQYFNNMLNEIVSLDSVENNYNLVVDEDTNKVVIDDSIENLDNQKLYNLVLIVDKYLCLTENNKNYIESEYIIIQHLMKSCFHQLLQKMYIIIKHTDMTIDNYDDAINVFKDSIGDIIVRAKNLKMIVNN